MQGRAWLCLIWSHREIDFPQKLINFSYSPKLEFKKSAHLLVSYFPSFLKNYCLIILILLPQG